MTKVHKVWGALDGAIGLNHAVVSPSGTGQVLLSSKPIYDASQWTAACRPYTRVAWIKADLIVLAKGTSADKKEEDATADKVRGQARGQGFHVRSDLAYRGPSPRVAL